MANGVDSINTITPVADFQAMLKRRDVDLVDKVSFIIIVVVFLKNSYINL